MIQASLIQRQIITAIAVLFSSLLTYIIIFSLSVLRSTLSPEIYLNRIALCSSAFLFSIMGGWFSFRLPGATVFSVWGTILVVLAMNVSKSTVFSWLLLEYVMLCFLLYKITDGFENQIGTLVVDREKYQNEKNDLAVSHSQKGEGISIFFEKYSTYYHLRKMAEELTTTLSVRQVCQKVVSRTVEFIARGDAALIALGAAGQGISVVAHQASKSYEKHVYTHGDLFDEWVIRSHKRLIVTDTHQDFRFDVKETVQLENIRSLVAVPLLHEGRVMGTLRLNSAKEESFSNDDLRLLDAIGTLASSAISNAKLYERTEELAIRDSLTGLYVRRYFYDRLKQEHGRALLTKRPLSLLMCDLDHFKDCNDQFGHGAGDLVLVRVAELMKQATENAIVARYGGEEFAILLPETSKEDAAKIAESVRLTIEKDPFKIRREKIKMTLSVGVATHPDDTLDVQMLMEKADRALYQAKRSGRNRVCLSEV